MNPVPLDLTVYTVLQTGYPYKADTVPAVTEI